MSEKTNFIWHCQRMGGTDQVMLSTMDELRHLRDLDPKLWGALSCPARGLEFNKRTLDLLDMDKDGRIRMPEILDAVEWLCARVNDTATIPLEPTSMPLSAISEETEEGKRLKTTATTILKTLGADTDTITPSEVETAAEKAAGQSFNGDGILPPFEDMESDVKEFVEAGLAIVGGAQDAGGSAGLNKELADALIAELQTYADWQDAVRNTQHPVPDTEGAWALLQEIKPKVDDYFLRCELASFAPEATAPLNAETRLAQAAEKSDIELDDLLTMPLSRVEGGKELLLTEGLNPIWKERIEAFTEKVAPLLANPGKLSKENWISIQNAFADYQKALESRPSVQCCDAGSFAPPEDPAKALENLGEEGVQRLLNKDIHAAFHALCDKDLANAAASEDIAELEKLVLFYCNMHRLLMNFVSFYDFYTLRPNVTFRAGTLYIDGRSCQLCVPVDDIAKHSAMAAMSQLCLLYCECTRRAEDGTITGTRSIMAVLTAGTDDVLVEGRNGVFVDNTGCDWDAKLVKIVHNPISFRQAMWSPYKRISKMAGEAVAKFASDKSAEGLAAAQKGMSSLATPKPASAPAAPFDISKGVGIFAAVGIALGAIGTAIGSIAQALFSLAWWQFPLLILGIFAVISGPSVFLAWLKFRKRTFGPVLEASGWAVNTQLPINIKLGSALTSVAKQPENIERQSILDPFREEKKSHTGLWLSILFLILAIAFGSWLWKSGKLESMITTITQQTKIATNQDKAKDAPEKDKAKEEAKKKDAPAPEASKKAEEDAKKDAGKKDDAAAQAPKPEAPAEKKQN